MTQKAIIIPELSDFPKLAPCPVSGHQWGDGLLVRTPNWLGDAVMTFPALAMLKKSLPATCGLFIACPKGLAPLFDEMEEAGQVIPLENAHAFPNASERYTFRELHSGATLLFNNSFRDAIALKLLGSRHLYGVKARHRSFLLKSKWSLPKRRNKVLNPYHQACVYLAMAKALGAGDWDGSMPHFHFREKESMQKDPEFAQIFQSNRPLLAVAPGAAYGDAKRWDSSRFRAVAEWWIHEQHGCVFAVGNASESAIAEEVLRGLASDRIFQLAGKTTMKQLMILLQQADCCLANDSGTMHLAA